MSRPSFTSLFVAGALALVGGLSESSATTLRRLPLRELIQRADLVVVGQAVSARSYWDGGRIKTSTTVRVDEVWLGKLGEGQTTVDVVSLGGVVGEIGQTVHAELAVHPGDRAVLCLGRSAGASHYFAIGMAQGAIRILDEGSDSRALHDAARVERDDAALRLVGDAVAPLPTTLGELRRAVMQEASREP